MNNQQEYRSLNSQDMNEFPQYQENNEAQVQAQQAQVFAQIQAQALQQQASQAQARAQAQAEAQAREAAVAVSAARGRLPAGQFVGQNELEDSARQSHRMWIASTILGGIVCLFAITYFILLTLFDSPKSYLVVSFPFFGGMMLFFMGMRTLRAMKSQPGSCACFTSIQNCCNLRPIAAGAANSTSCCNCIFNPETSTYEHGVIRVSWRCGYFAGAVLFIWGTSVLYLQRPWFQFTLGYGLFYFSLIIIASVGFVQLCNSFLYQRTLVKYYQPSLQVLVPQSAIPMSYYPQQAATAVAVNDQPPSQSAPFIYV